MKTKLNKTLFVLAAATAISAAPFTAKAASDSVSQKTQTEVERDADGSYVKKTTVESKDEAGTKVSDESKIKVTADKDGSYKKTIDSKSVRDPKGLMNKSVVKSSQTIKSDEDGYKDEASISAKNGNTGTKTVREDKVEVDTDKDGSVEKTSESKASTDPKGLMNKETVKTSDKIEKKSGDNNYHYTKKVNGKVVEEKSVKSE